MFCSSCGKSVNPGLSYCNHCGARAAGKADGGPGQMPESSFNLLVGSLIGVPIAGIGIIIGLLTVMKRELGFGEEMIGVIVLMSFILLLIAELGLLWLLRHHTKMSKRSYEPQQPGLPQTPDVVIKGLPEGQIHSIHQPMQSVTEHTTRTLDAVPREPR
jgi:hypothetical protein